MNGVSCVAARAPAPASGEGSAEVGTVGIASRACGGPGVVDALLPSCSAVETEEPTAFLDSSSVEVALHEQRQTAFVFARAAALIVTLELSVGKTTRALPLRPIVDRAAPSRIDARGYSPKLTLATSSAKYDSAALERRGDGGRCRRVRDDAPGSPAAERRRSRRAGGVGTWGDASSPQYGGRPRTFGNKGIADGGQGWDRRCEPNIRRNHSSPVRSVALSRRPVSTKLTCHGWRQTGQSCTYDCRLAAPSSTSSSPAAATGR